ncbi:MAG: elongation factor P 5-aminopentanone reductase [Lachnospiraceae bacterium]
MNGKQTVLVTGASRGIGKAIAEKFASAGAQLVLNCCHSETQLIEFQKKLKELYHTESLICIGDVADDGFVKDMFAQARERFGKVDVLINNAGISYIGLLTDMDLSDWNRVIQTNLTSVFSCCHEAIPDMVHEKSGAILNISSVWGTVGASCEVAYSTAKGGINAFTKALAKELAPSHISVNAIACGVIDTDMNACFSPEERKELEDEIPAGRYGTPQEVAELAYSIVTGPSYLTAQVITIDGGWI